VQCADSFARAYACQISLMIHQYIDRSPWMTVSQLALAPMAKVINVCIRQQ
jgi:hypothetical protein